MSGFFAYKYIYVYLYTQEHIHKRTHTHIQSYTHTQRGKTYILIILIGVCRLLNHPNSSRSLWFASSAPILHCAIFVFVMIGEITSDPCLRHIVEDWVIRTFSMNFLQSSCCPLLISLWFFISKLLSNTLRWPTNAFTVYIISLFIVSYYTTVLWLFISSLQYKFKHQVSYWYLREY